MAGSSGCLIALNCVIPQLLWSRKVRTHDMALFLVALSINLGMWVERFVIVFRVCIGILFPSTGRCISRPFGTGPLCSAASDCFSPCNFFSSAIFR